MKTQLYIQDIQVLFDDIQRSKIFDDQKTMTDALPLFDIGQRLCVVAEIEVRMFNLALP